ncbi:phosphotransferase enzyme family protein [Streptomyces liangshanensis]|uniref:Aminoglycoside phosphotransferase family protein n=1 Tax=Streptomyces liangshanensis TaxID=2717324 RepID=A0A6G9H387_9ACTN|nr:aminoglycoside phosphotransferase family protein [Streptomyces liangshanensis]QIQ04766.1 aminoglycoside phosphotransferase family protein [Streptomyces liangshanensis]
MNLAKTLPPPLRAWAERSVGPLGAVQDASHPRADSRVWDITDAQGRHFFVKQSPTPASYACETFGYQSAVPALGFGGAPRLVASDARDLALLLTAVPGTPLSRLTLTTAAHRSAHRQFGALLRRLHGSDRMPGPGRRAAAEAVEHTATTEVETHLVRAGALLTGHRRALVRRAAEHLLQLTDRLVPAHIHGDARERNALWTAAGSGRLAVVDFGRSRYAPAVQDFVRLACGPWQDRPDLRDAFFHGYGRDLTDSERQALTCLAALDAVSGLAYGPAHGDDEVTARGTRTLERLERGLFV